MAWNRTVPESRRGATRVPFQAGPLCPSPVSLYSHSQRQPSYIMLCMSLKAAHDVMHGEQCMAWHRTAPGIPKRSYTRAVQGRLALPRLLIQPQATNTHDVMHGEQWPATAAAEHALHRHPHSNLPKMSYMRVPFKAGRLCCVSRLRLYQQPSVWLVVMSWWFFEVLDGTETF